MTIDREKNFVIREITLKKWLKVMELFIALGFPIILLLGLTFLFMSEGIPIWIQNISSKSSTIWNFGIVLMSTIIIIIYLSNRQINN